MSLASVAAVQIEINGLAEPESDEATRICREDLNEVGELRRTRDRIKDETIGKYRYDSETVTLQSGR